VLYPHFTNEVTSGFDQLKFLEKLDLAQLTAR